MAVGIFILTSAIVGFLHDPKDFDASQARMPFTREWYTVFYMVATITAIASWLIVSR